MSRAAFPLWFFERAFAGSNTETAPRARSPWHLIAPWTTQRSVHRGLALATSAREQVPLGPLFARRRDSKVITVTDALYTARCSCCDYGVESRIRRTQPGTNRRRTAARNPVPVSVAEWSRCGITPIPVRAGKPNFTLVMLDGIPLNDITNILGGSFYLRGRSPDNIEQVEIVRGPLSSVYGDGPLPSGTSFSYLAWHLRSTTEPRYASLDRCRPCKLDAARRLRACVDAIDRTKDFSPP